ncbi:MAG: ABC transporter transmembrane domain-containing protein [Paracoccaceae bacterium]
MDRSIFAFIWRHSYPQQIFLLAVTLVSFPFLYLSLELPKQIINDAISGEPGARAVFGMSLGQVELLALLCAGFLAAVLAQGLLKMYINTRKGVIAERLLRRFRYQLITRVLRFPRPHFQRVSQGELVSMITAEAEPLGGIMGDLVAQPVFQGGMMATILAFLFIQNPWLGLAAVALIPLQAWLIPMLQRQLNVLNKERVREVRRLAEEIGESAAGAGDLRTNGGWRRRLAILTDRLGRLFEIRYRIYRKKFFMKFLNNFITQLTPFFFFSIGGYLVIQGELTVGALVAGLAAYKDLSAPWKELLLWYNQTQDMRIRWQIITERFAPRDLLDESLFEGRPDEIPEIRGPIAMQGVTVRDADGATVLDGLDLEIPAGATVGIASRSAAERKAFAEVLTREVLPAAGTLQIGGQDIRTLHQAVIAARIGYAGPRPYLFAGTIGDNLTMALRTRPNGEMLPEDVTEAIEEARRAGNSVDPAFGDWLCPDAKDLADRERLSAWWLQLTEAMGTDEYLFRRGIDAKFDAAAHPELAERLAALRPEIARRIEAAGLSKAVHRFDPERFNPGLPMGGNLLYATPAVDIMQEDMAETPLFRETLDSLGLADELLELGKAVLQSLSQVFGATGTEHPLFRSLEIDSELFARLTALEAKARAHGNRALSEAERNLIIAVPFRFSAEQIGEAFPAKLKARILELRAERRDELRERVGGLFDPIAEDRFARGLTVLENAVFGKIARGTGAKAQKLRDLVCEVMIEHGLKRLVAELIYDVPTGIGGANLPEVAHERIAFVRAAIKRPDILILDRALASHDRESRLEMRKRLRALLPQTTLIFLEEDFRHRDSFDVYVEIEDGRFVASPGAGGAADGEEARLGADLAKKVRKLETTELFAGIERRQLRLLAFASEWVAAKAGDKLFQAGDASDGAYLIADGRAELRWPDARPDDPAVTVAHPGRLIGDLSVLRGEPRLHDLVAATDVVALRVGAAELRSILENDIGVATSLLRTVSGYLVEVGGRLRDVRREHSGPAEPAE